MSHGGLELVPGWTRARPLHGHTHDEEEESLGRALGEVASEAAASDVGAWWPPTPDSWEGFLLAH